MHSCIAYIATWFPYIAVKSAVIFNLRLHEALQPILGELNESYKKFSTYITELKMDHKDGKVASAELSALLV